MQFRCFAELWKKDMVKSIFSFTFWNYFPKTEHFFLEKLCECPLFPYIHRVWFIATL
uniref:Uncharacterized protein n=1 Tax=Anguilla anguilla TaxID=7936 RepID=A0A0E9RVM5_ANGAN